MEPPLRGRLARIEHVKLKYLKSWILRTFSTNILTPLKRTLANKNSALEPFPVGIANRPSTPFRASNCIILKVVALIWCLMNRQQFFLSGLKSRDEIDRYEWVFELAVLLLHLQWNFDYGVWPIDCLFSCFCHVNAVSLLFYKHYSIHLNNN